MEYSYASAATALSEEVMLFFHLLFLPSPARSSQPIAVVACSVEFDDCGCVEVCAALKRMCVF